MGMDAAAVVQATKEHLPAMSALLGRSFETDPIARYLVGETGSGAHARGAGDKIAWLFGRSAQYAMRSGCAYTTPDVRGVAAWLGPMHPRMPFMQAVSLGLAAAPLKLGPTALMRLLRFRRLKGRLRRRAVRGPHWYLMLIAVDPPAQGRGLGAALLQPQLEDADGQRLPCYLETGVESNLGFFQKHGFAVSGHDTLPFGPKVWGMLRQPRSGK